MADAILETITNLILIAFMIGFGTIMVIGLWRIINEDMLGNEPKNKSKNKSGKFSTN